MPFLSRDKKLRFINTLWAASGGLLLTLGCLYAAHRGYWLAPSGVLPIALVLFWTVNLSVIGAIYFQLTDRFRDPSLSLPQMYWALVTTLLALGACSELDALFYLLLILTLVFGIFRVSARQFNWFCAAAVLGSAVLLTVRQQFSDHRPAIDVAVEWTALSFSAIALTSLCKSIVGLRNRLRRKNSQLQHALQAKSQFLANMSHEIRTPMNGVLGMLDITLREDLPPRQRRNLVIAQNSAQSLLYVINDILDFSKIEAGKLSIEVANVPLAGLLSGITAGFNAQLEGKQVQLNLELAHDLPERVETDPVRLTQILNNLIGNAIKFTEHGAITVRAEKESLPAGGMHVHFMVQDTGIGIHEKDQTHLFEAFTQADNSTTRKYGGTGLGLGIARELCQLLGGDISVYSEPGKGSTFHFFIAAREASRHRDELPDLTGLRVLLCDREGPGRTALMEQLAFLKCHTTVADDTDQALSVWQREAFSVVLINNDFDGHRGATLATRIRALEYDNSTPIVLLFTQIPADVRQVTEDLMIASVLTRPVETSELASALQKASRAAGNQDTRTNTQQQRRGHILLVEDNETNQDVARFVLEELGHRVSIADDGQAALDWLWGTGQIDPPDAILMDCQMPVMDGYTATGQIRHGQLPDSVRTLPIIAMTANAMHGDREKCLEAGMDDYLAKPIDSAKLNRTLQHWLTPRSQRIEEPAPAPDREPCNAPKLWNYDELFRNVGMRQDRVVRLAGSFIRNLSKQRTELEMSVERLDGPEIRTVAHAIKGGAANLRAEKVSQLAGKIEAAARDSRIQDIPPLMNELNTLVEATISHISEFLQEHTGQ